MKTRKKQTIKDKIGCLTGFRFLFGIMSQRDIDYNNYLLERGIIERKDWGSY